MSVSETMRSYMNTIRGLPVVSLSDDDAWDLLEAGEADVLFMHLSKIAPYVVNRYIAGVHERENYQDLIQEGNMAVLIAMQSWRPHKGMSIFNWCYRAAQRATQRELNRDNNYLDQHAPWDFDAALEVDSDLLDEEPIDSDGGDWETAQEYAARYRAIHSKLGERDQQLLTMLKDGQTQDHVANVLGISQSRVSRITGDLYQRIIAVEA